MKYFGQGLIQVYTGNGKGKTTAAMGLAIRALGHGFKVFIVQFMKSRKDSGEGYILQRLAPDCVLEEYGKPGFVRKGQAQPEDLAEAAKALNKAREVILSSNWNLVILDEIINAIWFELINEEEVLQLLAEKPAHVEVVLTGRNASERLRNRADLVTEMLSLKHPYDQGVSARKGIEY
jgi:cob(I)alamin adenosyltransferase